MSCARFIFLYNIRMFKLQPPKPISTESSPEQSKDYQEVPRDSWLDIVPNTHIRYKKHGNENILSAFLISKSHEHKILNLRSNLYDPNSYKTNIGLDKIEKIWQKTNIPVSNVDTSTLARIVKALADRLTTVEHKVNDGQSEDISQQLVEIRLRQETLESDMRKILVTIQELIEEINKIP